MTLNENEVLEIQEVLFLSSNSDLAKYDLLDHICCSIEEQMETGISFETARTNAFNIFQPEYIDELDQTTLYLTKPQLYMSRKSIISGVIGLSISLLAIVGKQLDITGSNEALIIGALIIVFGFLLGGIITLNKGVQLSRFRAANWIAFISGMIVIAGITLFILKYSLAALILLSGGGLLFIVYFILISSHTRSLLS